MAGKSMTARIVVGMSGGVDSAVAALRLVEQGHEVIGLFMKNWDEDDGTAFCTAKQDQDDAAQVCERLGIPLRTVNFAAEYWDDVFEVFLREYRSGRTPNPDILCNKHIKFKAFLEHALNLGAERIATGHYARTGGDDTRRTLSKGLDLGKDQSYFLYAMSPAALQCALFPVGELNKSEVRDIARRAGFANHRKKDSTGICFIGERRFREFLARFLTAEPGEMRTPDGTVVGEHHGIMYYTLGQRQGLGIGGRRDGGGDPWYVLAKNPATNTLIVGQGHDHPLLYTDTLEADSLDWLGDPLPGPLRCAAKTRYRQPDQDCQAEPLGDGRLRVVFDRPQRAVTPGQSVVLYRDDECLGGGIIATAYNRATVAAAA